MVNRVQPSESSPGGQHRFFNEYVLGLEVDHAWNRRRR